MRRILLDTNIYGLVVERHEEETFKELMNKSSYIVYGCSLIRKELRDTPKNKQLLTVKGIRSLRLGLLQLYDNITKDHQININVKTENLADKYLQKFSEATGQVALGHLKIDFLLVACATLNKLDLIVSEDHKTLLSSDAIRSYHFVNKLEGFELPLVLKYEELKQFIRRSFLS